MSGTALELDRASLIAGLKKGVCQITYKKNNGETRKATGTLKKALVDDIVPTPVGGDNKSTVNYYDLEKNAWRSFRVSSVKKASLND